MTELEIIEDNRYFTAGVIKTRKGEYRPFFQSHEREDDFEEEPAYASELEAYMRLAEIIIQEIDDNTDDADLESTGDFEPCVSLIGGTLPHKEDF